LVSALISPHGTPAKLLAEVQGADLELIVSPLLLDELGRVLRRRKFRRYVAIGTAEAFLEFIRRESIKVPDPVGPAPLHCVDPDDDYLIALAHSQKAVLVSGDAHLLELADRAPICAPADFHAT